MWWRVRRKLRSPYIEKDLENNNGFNINNKRVHKCGVKKLTQRSCSIMQQNSPSLIGIYVETEECDR